MVTAVNFEFLTSLFSATDTPSQTEWCQYEQHSILLVYLGDGTQAIQVSSSVSHKVMSRIGNSEGGLAKALLCRERLRTFRQPSRK